MGSSWTSILPAGWETVESWLVRFFLFAGLITIGPWAALMLYDLLLYISRTAAYEVPLYGGRARGRARPRAPSLSEHANGQPRRFSLGGRAAGGSGHAAPIASGRDAAAGLKGRMRLEDPTFDAK